MVCDPWLICRQGRCECEDILLTDCNEECRDLTAAHDNCGVCGLVCDPWLVCRDSACQCPEDVMEVCNETCVNKNTDINNCGDCGYVCDPDKTCVDGECICPDEGWGVCDGFCVNLMEDELNCGDCGTICEPEVECRYGRCGGPELFPGVRNHVPIAELRGWVECWRDTYNSSGQPIAQILQMCNHDVLLMGCRQPGSDELYVAAAGLREDVLFECGQDEGCTHEANGVGWYFNDSWSWGFVAAGEMVRRFSCDTADSQPLSRLCWHTGGGQINNGYRCGDQYNGDWERVLFH